MSQVVAKILDAAELCLSAPPPGAWTANNLAVRAGCSRSTLYRHFASLSAVELAVLGRLRDALHSPSYASAEAGRRRSRSRTWQFVTGLFEKHPAMLSALLVTPSLVGPFLRVCRRLDALTFGAVTIAVNATQHLGLSCVFPLAPIIERVDSGWLHPWVALPQAANWSPPPVSAIVSVRGRLVACARAAMSGRMGRALTLEEIARAAGLGVVTPYRHFVDRAGLFMTLTREFEDEVGDLFTEAHADGPHALTAITGRLSATLFAHRGLVANTVGPYALPSVRDAAAELAAKTLSAIARIADTHSRSLLPTHVRPDETPPIALLLLGLAILAARASNTEDAAYKRATQWTHHILKPNRPQSPPP